MKRYEIYLTREKRYTSLALSSEQTTHQIMDTPLNNQTACKELVLAREAMQERLNSLRSLYRYEESSHYLASIIWEIIDYETNEFDMLYKAMSNDTHLYKVIIEQMDSLEKIYEMLESTDIMQLVDLSEKSLRTILATIDKELELLA